MVLQSPLLEQQESQAHTVHLRKDEYLELGA